MKKKALLFATLLVLFSGCDKEAKNNEPKNNDPAGNQQSDIVPEPITNKNISEEDKILFNKYLNGSFNASGLVIDLYKDKKITMADMTDKIVLENAWANMSHYDDITIPELREQVIKLYGNDIVRNYGTYFDGDAVGFRCNNEKEICIQEGAYGITILPATNDILNVEEVNGIKYFYEEVIFIESVQDTFTLYSDINMKDIIFSNSGVDTAKINAYEAYINSKKTLSKYVKENYPNAVYKYKHTFEKNSKGEYVWVSTEPVK